MTVLVPFQIRDNSEQDHISYFELRMVFNSAADLEAAQKIVEREHELMVTGIDPRMDTELNDRSHHIVLIIPDPDQKYDHFDNEIYRALREIDSFSSSYSGYENENIVISTKAENFDDWQKAQDIAQQYGGHVRLVKGTLNGFGFNDDPDIEAITVNPADNTITIVADESENGEHLNYFKEDILNKITETGIAVDHVEIVDGMDTRRLERVELSDVTLEDARESLGFDSTFSDVLFENYDPETKTLSFFVEEYAYMNREELAKKLPTATVLNYEKLPDYFRRVGPQ